MSTLEEPFESEKETLPFEHGLHLLIKSEIWKTLDFAFKQIDHGDANYRREIVQNYACATDSESNRIVPILLNIDLGLKTTVLNKVVENVRYYFYNNLTTAEAGNLRRNLSNLPLIAELYVLNGVYGQHSACLGVKEIVRLSLVNSHNNSQLQTFPGKYIQRHIAQTFVNIVFDRDIDPKLENMGKSTKDTLLKKLELKNNNVEVDAAIKGWRDFVRSQFLKY